LVILTSLFISCNSNNGTDGDNTSVSGYLLDIGYENCLVCHTGGINPISHHCLSLEPITYTEIKDDIYSPKLSECLSCHLPHPFIVEKVISTIACTDCHVEY